MHRSLDSTIRTLRQGLDLRLDEDAIERARRSVGHRWRSCLPTPSVLIRWFLPQVLHGNTAIEHITLIAGRRFTASAYCQARARLPLAVPQALLRRLIESLRPLTLGDDGRWLGHRTFLIDGSAFSMPDAPELRAHFGQPGAQRPGRGFPVAKIPALFHARTGLLLSVTAAPPRTHEMSRVEAVHGLFEPGDVLLGDCGFCSHAHLAPPHKRGVHAAFGVHQKQLIDFTPGRPQATKGGPAGRPRSRWVGGLGRLDQIVEWHRPEARPGWMSAEDFEALPATPRLRELRYKITRKGSRSGEVTLVTTLLDGQTYTAEALAELYRGRWRVEGKLRALKQTMGMDELKCRSVAGVRKELMAYAIVYNLVRPVMVEAADRQGVDPDRVSFIDAMRWLIEARPGDGLPRLVVNPSRPDRLEPRVRKRRPKQYPLMTKSRQQ